LLKKNCEVKKRHALNESILATPHQNLFVKQRKKTQT